MPKAKADKAMDLNAPLESILKASKNHSTDFNEPERDRANLQSALRAAWKVMTVDQKRAFLRSDAVKDLVNLGARGEFDVPALQDNLELKLVTMKSEIMAAGFKLVPNEGYWYWDFEDEAGHDFSREDDAIVDAYMRLTKQAPHDKVA